MDVAAAQAFLREHHHAVLTTFRSDGRPQLSPVVCAVDEVGRVVVSTRETAMKTRNLRRDPRVALCVFTKDFFGPWVQVEGAAEIVELPAAMQLLVDYYRQVAGEHDDWDDYRAAMHREGRVVVRFAITRAGPNIAG
jgi:PPOX class probable F420-dependent enzyme